MKQVLAIFAALFLLVRPLCDVQAAGVAQDARQGNVYAMVAHDAADAAQHGEAPCCAYFDRGAVAKLGEPAAVRLAADGKPAVAPAAWHFARRAHTPEVVARPSLDGLFPPSSYYARSARIQR